MALLAELKCTVCQADDIPLNMDDIADYMSQTPEWEVLDEKGVNKLSRVFNFKDYTSALDFTNLVGRLAEEHGHHPTLITEWGKVTVIWWTHKISGLHENDFIMAARTDKLYQE